MNYITYQKGAKMSEFLDGLDNYFEILNSIDVTDKIEKKNGLSYLSWAYAWGELKKLHPDATYTIYENKDEMNYFTDGRTGWVKTGVTVEGIEHIEYLPIMDYKNKSIPVNDITSFDVNKAIQRSLTKAVARHGLGLYIYAGEDLPEQGATVVKTEAVKSPNAKNIEELIANCETEEALADVYKKYKFDIVSNQELLDKVAAKGKTLKKVA